jgi:hypothetical protein
MVVHHKTSSPTPKDWKRTGNTGHLNTTGSQVRKSSTNRAETLACTGIDEKHVRRIENQRCRSSNSEASKVRSRSIIIKGKGLPMTIEQVMRGFSS